VPCGDECYWCREVRTKAPEILAMTAYANMIDGDVDVDPPSISELRGLLDGDDSKNAMFLALRCTKVNEFLRALKKSILETAWRCCRFLRCWPT